MSLLTGMWLWLGKNNVKEHNKGTWNCLSEMESNLQPHVGFESHVLRNSRGREKSVRHASKLCGKANEELKFCALKFGRNDQIQWIDIFIYIIFASLSSTFQFQLLVLSNGYLQMVYMYKKFQRIHHVLEHTSFCLKNKIDSTKIAQKDVELSVPSLGKMSEAYKDTNDVFELLVKDHVPYSIENKVFRNGDSLRRCNTNKSDQNPITSKIDTTINTKLSKINTILNLKF